tara:strand:- start:15265 stop:15687 length:423 start_codon:yes stop_codon:yes gene_type:complete
MSDGLGATLWRENDVPVFEQVAGVRSFGDLDFSADTYDDSTVDQTDRWKRKSKGMIDAGETEVVLVWKDATSDPVYDTLIGDLEADTVRNYQVQLPTTGKTAFTLPALVTGIGAAFPVGDKMARKIKLTLSGKPTQGVWV